MPVIGLWLFLYHLTLSLQISSSLLFEFQAFEEGFEVAFAEALGAAAADDFYEEGWAVLEGFGEELEEVAFVVGVYEDTEVADSFVVFFDHFVAVLCEHFVDAFPDEFVVGVRSEERRVGKEC